MKDKTTKRHKIGTVIGIILCIIILPIVIMNGTIVIKSFLNPSEVPDFLGYKPFIVLSGSMEPKINVNDIAMVKEADPATVKKNDIISYKIQDSVITHRVVGTTKVKGKMAFVMKGDNNNTEDIDPVLYSQVEGKLLYVIPKLGRVAMFLQTPLGIVCTLGIPILIFIIYDSIKRRKFNKKQSLKLQSMEEELAAIKD